MSLKTRTLICLAICLMTICVYGQASTDEKMIEATVNNFHQGFILSDELLVKNSCANTLIMFNGNFSDDQYEWQPHMSLGGDEIVVWASWMIRNAGPHANRIVFESIKTRQNAALVVTRESGSNKFRKWTAQTVTYLLNKREAKWAITGFFIRDIRNPD